jgi:hypothetical protein
MIIRKLDYIRSKQAKLQKYGQWHDWFAWYPVRIDESRIVWLETVKRKICAVGTDDPRFYGWDYTLR